MHRWKFERLSLNQDRRREVWLCQCGAVKHTCLAYRLDWNGQPAWGRPGETFVSVREPYPLFTPLVAERWEHLLDGKRIDGKPRAPTCG